MNIAVDAFIFNDSLSTGVANYFKNILFNLLKLDTENEYYLYSRDKFDFFPAKNVHLRFSGSRINTSASWGSTFWLFTSGLYMMRKDKIDVFWGTRQMLPIIMLRDIKMVLTAYDLVWHYYPETMEWYNHFIMNMLARKSIESADRIITISKASFNSLITVMGINQDKIDIIYPAADNYVPLDKVNSAEYISKKYGTNKRYVLTVGTIEPRKNIGVLLELFSKLKHEGLQLLIAGGKGWKNSDLYKKYNELSLTENEVKFLGYVDDGDMNQLYSGAQLFVFPSVYEGFGMPVLEAMASGTAVITSNISSLPEVAADAGILVAPQDVKSLQEAIIKVTSDELLSKKMSERGLVKAKSFSWERSAIRTLEVFNGFKVKLS